MVKNRKVRFIFAFREYVNISNKKRVFVGFHGNHLYALNRRDA